MVEGEIMRAGISELGAKLILHTCSRVASLVLVLALSKILLLVSTLVAITSIVKNGYYRSFC